MKQQLNQSFKSRLNWWLAAPFLLYITLYILSVIVSLFYGAQPILVPSSDSHKEELRREWIAEKLESGDLPNLLLVVATNEIESCFYNPGEVYPEGYTDIRQGREYYLEPKKLYVGKTHYLFTLGLPKTTVVACSNPQL